MDDLKDFDPLRDAIVFPDDPIWVELNGSFHIKMKGEKFNLQPGGEELPTYLAVFLIGRKLANIV